MKLIALLLMIAGPSGAAEWLKLDGPAIEGALTGRQVVYANATQNFAASGETNYFAGRPSVGRWRVVGPQYCSQWPPGDGWSCYDFFVSIDGLQVRFMSPEGSVTDGRYKISN